MNGRSRSTLFLIEQLIVITVFAVCASVCVNIFISSFLMANESRGINHALIAAKNGAECYKVYGDPGKTAAFLNGREHASGVSHAVVYYDAGWRVCDEAKAAYMMRLRSVPANESLTHVGYMQENAKHPLLCELSVEKITGEELISFTVSTIFDSRRGTR